MRNTTACRLITRAGATLLPALLLTLAPGRAGAQVPAPAAPSAAYAPKVMCLGDSITYGTSTPQAAPGGYRTFLDEDLKNAGYACQFIGSFTLNSSPTLDMDGQAAQEGHPGYKIEDIDTLLDGFVSLDGQENGGYYFTGTTAGGVFLRPPAYPDIVLLHLGTNNQADPVTTRMAKLYHLVDKITHLRPYAHVIVAADIPVEFGDNFFTFNYSVRDYRDAIRDQLVPHYQALGEPVTFCDQYSPFVIHDPSGALGVDQPVPGLMSADGVHPMMTGYKVMADTWLPAIQAIGPIAAPPPVGTGAAPAAPAGLTAVGGRGQVTLSWSPADGAGGYRIYRGTASGQETVIRSGVTGTSYTDGGLADGTTYYYTVTALGTAGESTPSREASATPKAPGLSINCGGGAAGAFGADEDATGGYPYATTHAVATAGVTNPAPQAVYQSVRFSPGSFTYAIPGLTPGAPYTVRLHLVNYNFNPGQIVFNVAANGATALSNFDPAQAVGAQYAAVEQDVPVTADASGTVTLAFTTVKGAAAVAGIEVK